MSDATSEEKIVCRICGTAVHAVKQHLTKAHADKGWTLDDYKEKYPDAPTLSAYALRVINSANRKKATETATPAVAPVVESVISDKAEEKAMITTTANKQVEGSLEFITEKVALHEVLEMPLSDLKSAMGRPIMITAFINTPFPEYCRDPMKDYVFDSELAIDTAMAIEMNMPIYLWGHAGTGKTSLLMELCSRINKPFTRVQHTGSTEESEITGQILANKDGTYFEAGLLSFAMRHGLFYIADEYDFAFAQVLSAYQAVMEGEDLIIKGATPEWRRVKRHKYSGFGATGNTNGSGDESGLYQGTNIQNTANYSRFAIVERVGYMKPEMESKLIQANTKCRPEDAMKLVDFATRVRTAHEAHDMPLTIGPRELIHAARVGLLRADYAKGLRKAWINKLPATFSDAAEELLKRVF